MDPFADAHVRKSQIRKEAAARRRRQVDAEQVSRQILQRLAAQPEYSRSQTILFYVSFRSEVGVHESLSAAMAEGKRVVVPYCVGNRLDLFRLETLEELTPGTMGILEPKADLRARADRKVLPQELALIVAPGLAFDRQCGRIGYGKGYYDRLLHEVRDDAAIVAVAFECQIFPDVPLLPYDVRVDKIVTEAAVYERTLPRFALAEGS